MLDVRYSHLYFYQSLNRLQRGLFAIAELLVILDMYYQIYLMMDVLLSTVRDTSQEYQRFLPPISEQQLCERVRQRVPAPMTTADFFPHV